MSTAVVYGFRAYQPTSTDDIITMPQFALKLEMIKKTGKKEAVWCFETKEAAEQARSLAEVEGLNPREVVEYMTPLRN